MVEERGQAAMETQSVKELAITLPPGSQSGFSLLNFGHSEQLVHSITRPSLYCFCFGLCALEKLHHRAVKMSFLSE